MNPHLSISSASHLRGEVVSPGDKSISHRALLLSALAEGPSSVVGLSLGQDVACTRNIIEDLGATTNDDGDRLIIEGGVGHLRPSASPLNCGNSGTTMRLTMGLVAGLPGTSSLYGDASLSARPMDRVAVPLEQMGASVVGVGNRLLPPIEVTGGPLRAISYEVPVASAQVKSALLLAALFADGDTIVVESTPTRPNTEEMLKAAGVGVRWRHVGHGTEITVTPGPVQPREWTIPGDPSQAAFFIVAGLLAASSQIHATGLYGDPTRIGFLSVLERMGASMERTAATDGLLTVVASSSDLRGVEIHSSEIPSVDEVPILTVAAAAAEGTTRFIDMAELRIKESDRFAGSLALASGLGARAWAEGDDLCVQGVGSAARFSTLLIDAQGDHRMAMSAAIAGSVGSGAQISGFDSVETSYPGFLDVLDSLR